MKTTGTSVRAAYENLYLAISYTSHSAFSASYYMTGIPDTLAAEGLTTAPTPNFCSKCTICPTKIKQP
jgi:hypothetical protein